MIIGIISEGAEDQGVIKNILIAVAKNLGLELEVRFIRPSLGLDASKLHNTSTIGTLQGVKNACIEKEDFERFFIDEDNLLIVIHLDTAEIDINQDFTFARPTKLNNPNYSVELRNLVIEKIKEWLNNQYEDKLLFAIAIEEIEAWCLTIFETDDTTYLDNLKNKLQRHLDRKNLTYKQLRLDPTKQKSLYFETFTKKFDFHKLKKLKEFAKRNHSLQDFIESIEEALKKFQ